MKGDLEFGEILDARLTIGGPGRGMRLWHRVRDFARAFFVIMGFFALAILFVRSFGRHRGIPREPPRRDAGLTG